MKELILKVINGELESVEVPFQKLDIYVDILKSLGFEIYDFDTNGYQVDFWLNFIKNNNVYCLEGSLFYSDTFTFSKDGKTIN